MYNCGINFYLSYFIRHFLPSFSSELSVNLQQHCFFPVDWCGFCLLLGTIHSQGSWVCVNHSMWYQLKEDWTHHQSQDTASALGEKHWYLKRCLIFIRCNEFTLILDLCSKGNCTMWTNYWFGGGGGNLFFNLIFWKLWGRVFFHG